MADSGDPMAPDAATTLREGPLVPYALPLANLAVLGGFSLLVGLARDLPGVTVLAGLVALGAWVALALARIRRRARRGLVTTPWRAVELRGPVDAAHFRDAPAPPALLVDGRARDLAALRQLSLRSTAVMKPRPRRFDRDRAPPEYTYTSCVYLEFPGEVVELARDVSSERAEAVAARWARALRREVARPGVEAAPSTFVGGWRALGVGVVLFYAALVVGFGSEAIRGDAAPDLPAWRVAASAFAALAVGDQLAVALCAWILRRPTRDWARAAFGL